jgi:hypothetical protein
MSDRDGELPAALADVVEVLRERPAIDPAWRAELLWRATSNQSARQDRGLRLGWPAAIAAGIMCMLAGGAIALFAVRGPAPAPSPVAAAAGSTQTLPVRFSVVAPGAAKVSIVGDFNEWNPESLPMRRSSDERLWEVEVRLPLGRYSYAFVIDGKLAPDPAAPRSGGDDFGTPNSLLLVRGS